MTTTGNDDGDGASARRERPPGRFIRSGKVKDIYDLDSDHLLFHFTDRVSAFDVVLPSSIPDKGEALCKIGAFWFETLGVPNHMVRVEGSEHDGREEDQHDNGRVRRQGLPLRQPLREDEQGRGLPASRRRSWRRSSPSPSSTRPPSRRCTTSRSPRPRSSSRG